MGTKPRAEMNNEYMSEIMFCHVTNDAVAGGVSRNNPFWGILPSKPPTKMPTEVGRCANGVSIELRNNRISSPSPHHTAGDIHMARLNTAPRTMAA